MMKAQVALYGNVGFRDQYGREQRAQNVMASGGLTLIRDYLAAPLLELAPSPPSWIVLGSGTAPTSRFMTQVPGETFRTAIIARDASGDAVIYHGWISDADNANQTVGTVGLVGGTDATQSAGTGTLIAVANVPVPFGKDAITTYSISWQITISGVIS